MAEKKGNKPKEEIDELTQAKVLSEHDYDGIKELDNEMPAWWRYLFYASILFAMGYLMRYHVFKAAPLQEEEYLAQIEVPEEESTAGISVSSGSGKTAELFPLESKEDLNEGAQIFRLNCAVCHKENAGGLVGPNLTDEYWIHGGSYNDIIHTISNGVPAKGMIAWKNQLSQQKIEQVGSYVWSLYGSNPSGAMKPQGEKYERTEQ